MRKWTQDQLAAIEARNCNLLVSAAAGSGKTALLIERIKRLILFENVDVRELLVMTFTRAAASEMKERLRIALTQALSEPKLDTYRITDQLYRLNRASISTLDAFCTAFLRENFQSAGIDPDFKMGNEAELKILQREAAEEVLESYYESIPEDGLNDFGKMAEMYSESKRDESLIQLILDLQSFLDTIPNSQQWCEEAIAHFDFSEDTFFASFWGRQIKDHAKKQLEMARDYLDSAIEETNGEEIFQKTIDLLENEKMQILAIEDILESGEYFDFASALQHLVFNRYPGIKKTAEDETKEKNESIKNLRDTAKAILNALKSQYGSDPQEALSALKEMKGPVFSLIEVTRAFQEVYFEKKKAQSLLDFSDTERLTLQVLKENDALRESLRQRYKYVFMDEYQDTNGMQEAILQCIVREDNYFMVGDVKQSIYRFRLADPGIFIEKLHAFQEDEDESAGGPNRLITLGQNFRSSSSVIHSVNTVFEKVMNEQIGEVAYDAQAKLYPGLPLGGPDIPTEIHLCVKKEQDESCMDNQDEEDFSNIEREARYLAGQIQNMIGKPLYRTRLEREKPIDYGDIGILMRGVSGKGEIFKRVFKEAGIPLYFNGGDVYFETNEVSLIINLLKLIDNPQQDLPLLSVLLSPIGGFSSEECAQVRENTEGRYFHQVFWDYPNQREKYSEDLKTKINDLKNSLEKWRFDLQIMDTEAFLWKIYRETGYYTFVGGLSGGEQRQSNLRQLLTKASTYKKMTMKGIFHFVRMVEDLRQRKMDDVPSGILDGQENAVQLMTIHKSKGLEFPVVIIAGAAGRFNTKGNGGKLLFHKNLGLCPECIRIEKNQRFSTIAHGICKEKQRLESLSEEMRLLYVAMTRAEEKLMVVGTFSQRTFASRQKKWDESVDVYHCAHVSGPLDWVMMAGQDRQYFKVMDGNGSMISTFSQEDVVEEKDLSSEEKEAIIQKLSWKYAYSEGDVLPEKMTVTEINRYRQHHTMVQDLPEISPRPAFMMKSSDEISFEKWTAADIGTAIHGILSDIDFSMLRQCTNISEMIESHVDTMVEKEKMIGELRDTLDLAPLVSFFESELGQRLLNSKKIWREKPFNYVLEANDVLEAWKGKNEKIIVQGMIDCCFLEKEEWVLLDYKTDRYRSSEEVKVIADKYRMQLTLYGEALEKITGIRVKEKDLVLLSGHEIIRL